MIVIVPYLVRFARKIPPFLASTINKAISLKGHVINSIKNQPLVSTITLRPSVRPVRSHKGAINLKHNAVSARSREYSRLNHEGEAIGNENNSIVVVVVVIPLTCRVPCHLERGRVVCSAISNGAKMTYVKNDSGIDGRGRPSIVFRRTLRF